jgi:hypothetical protein
MATFTKLNGFVEQLAKGYHGNMATATFSVALSNTAPGSESTPPTGAETTCILANVTQVSYTNLSSRTITTTSCVQTSGTLSLILVDLVLTASGAVGPFRYVYIVNTSSTTRTNALVGYYDYGSSISLANGETFTIDFDGTNGLLQIA